jgi:hypothetical protein
MNPIDDSVSMVLDARSSSYQQETDFDTMLQTNEVYSILNPTF